MKQELLEKIDEKAAETQTELHNVVETLNKRLDKVENHTSAWGWRANTLTS